MVLVSSAVVSWFEPRSGLAKDDDKIGNLLLAAMCLNGAACFPADCCLSELAL